jgi:hypothetical protein
MADYSTLHIFGYGECQVIGDNFNYKVPTSSCTTAQAVIDNVYAQKPQGSTASYDYHAINIFNNLFADWQPNSGDGFRVQYDQLSAVEINALVDEIIALATTTTTTSSTTTIQP